MLCMTFCSQIKHHDQRSSPREVSLNFNENVQPFPKPTTERNEKAVVQHSKSKLTTTCPRAAAAFLPSQAVFECMLGILMLQCQYLPVFCTCLTLPNLKLNLQVDFFLAAQ